MSSPGDVWHSGLKMGTAGLPRAIDFVVPTWMFNRDPDPEISATSWRLSLGACLVRADVVNRLGTVDPAFQTLAGAGLELGYRYLRWGAIVRSAPSLLPGYPTATVRLGVPLADEFRFIRRAFGDFWTRWVLWRMLANGYPPFATVSTFFKVMREPSSRPRDPYVHRSPDNPSARVSLSSVSVLVPTLGRYPELRALLEQLRSQTSPPSEIIIVDQNDPHSRDERIATDFADLDIRMLYRLRRGQSSSRNQGLEASRGDLILLLDDDIEIDDHLVERHLALFTTLDADASCGVAEERGSQPLPESFSYVRVSDVFPAGNTLLRKASLSSSGVFDAAFDTGPRADLDLGMRLYLSGKLLLLNPPARVVHLRAPKGGLRTYEARVVTYATSRGSVVLRHIPAPTEIYLWTRYFSQRQVSEALMLRLAGTLATRGPRVQRAVRFAVGLALLPLTWSEIRKACKQAEELKNTFPRVADVPFDLGAKAAERDQTRSLRTRQNAE